MPPWHSHLRAVVAAEETLSFLIHTVRKEGWRLKLFELKGLVVDNWKDAYRKPFLKTMLYSGAAMAPTLNRRALQLPDAIETLLYHDISRYHALADGIWLGPYKWVWVGDVVVFRKGPRHLVRRVAAVAGDRLVTGEDESAESFVLGPGKCWVLADNKQLAPSEAYDSRSFGPLDLKAIYGRVLYAGRSMSDHGPVDSAAPSRNFDQKLLEAELDLKKIFKQ